MTDIDKNELVQSLMRLRKRCCGGVSAACMTTNARMAKDNAEFQKLIQGVKALIAERDNLRWEVCELSSNGSIDGANREAESRGWDYLVDD